jgi:hypothetical protein
MKKLSNTFNKLIRVNKYFLIVINSNEKTDKIKEKYLNQLKWDNIYIKEWEIDKEALKVLLLRILYYFFI